MPIHVHKEAIETVTMPCILLIEDNLDMRDSIAMLLEYQGYEVVAASNGQEGLERLRTMERPCLILLDLMMPVMDGWTFRAELLRTPELAAIPVIILSGAEDAEDAAERLRCVDHLSKPFPADRLYRTVRDHC